MVTRNWTRSSIRVNCENTTPLEPGFLHITSTSSSNCNPAAEVQVRFCIFPLFTQRIRIRTAPLRVSTRIQSCWPQPVPKSSFWNHVPDLFHGTCKGLEGSLGDCIKDKLAEIKTSR
jgi:hypothetical protein